MRRKRGNTLSNPNQTSCSNRTFNLPPRLLQEFALGNFSVRAEDLKSQGFSSQLIPDIVEHYNYTRQMSNSGLGFIGEWGYWMMLQAHGMYEDSLSYYKTGSHDAPKPLLRINARHATYPVQSCCFLPGKHPGKITDARGNGLQAVFPYTCCWEYGATPDMYIGPRLDYMSIDEFKRMSSPEDHQGYRIVEIKTVSKTYNEFIPVKDRYGRISCDRDGNYIPMKDANGNNILTGEKIIKVQINAHTHIQAEELLLFAKRNKNNTRATHLGHITLGRLEKLRAGSDLRGTNCVRLSWLRTDPEELIDEIKSRCRTYLGSTEH